MCLALIQSRERPDRYGALMRFEIIPSRPNTARRGEQGGTVRLDMLVDDDAAGLPCQELRQARLALVEGLAPQVLAIHLDQVEGVQERLAEPALAMQSIEHGNPIGTADDRLAIDHERSGAELASGESNHRIPRGPVLAAAGEQANQIAVTTGDQPVAMIMLDFVCQPRPSARSGAGVTGGMNSREDGAYAASLWAAIDLGGRVWPLGAPCKGGPLAAAFGGWRP